MRKLVRAVLAPLDTALCKSGWAVQCQDRIEACAASYHTPSVSSSSLTVLKAIFAPSHHRAALPTSPQPRLKPPPSSNTLQHHPSSTNMGSSHSTPDPHLIRKEVLSCDRNGRAKFNIETRDLLPAAPGYYKIICNVNFNDTHVFGRRVNGERTHNEFSRIMYVNHCSLSPISSCSLDLLLGGGPEFWEDWGRLGGWGFEGDVLLISWGTPPAQGPRGNTRFFRYCPNQRTPVLRGFCESFVAMPGRNVSFECWWFPLDGKIY